MVKLTKFLTGLILGAVSLALVIGAGYYKSSDSVANEGGSIKLTLPQTNSSKIAQQKPAKITPVIVDVNSAGLPKKLLQPWVVRVSSKGIVNKDNKEHTLQFELSDKSIPVEWSVRDASWNDRDKLLAKPLKPGGKTSITLVFKIPKELRNKTVVYEGGLKVADYKTKEQLAYVPIKILNSDRKNKGDKECCKE
ncbi:MAG: hypothetical protein RO469_09135 [Thermincola sp.]|jgi:hypothetical protein|nr:hypothetical protein [Thermincola sp.]MDT3702266.1 hypothetical protein [Thermincola sp.]